uniref:(northern house mosquito) hypothetical protein n=2 Tax=Culex pipiens TaxID=7175 RepID=A0A8D8D5M5_CULPI
MRGVLPARGLWCYASESNMPSNAARRWRSLNSVSGGEFYDPTNGSNLGGPGSVQGSLHNLPESEGSGEGAPADTIVPPKGFVRPEINFIAKLRQRQRQRALVPAVAIAVGQHQPVPVEVADPDSDYPDVDLATLGEDLEMVVRFLDQHWVELFGGGGEEPAGDQPQQMQPGQKRAAALRTSMSRRSNSFNMPKERFSPSISVGALTNLGDFFQNLKHNLETLETRDLSNEQVKLLEGQNMITNLRKEFIEDYPKPAGSAAFLHAIRNYRPSSRIRALVSSVPDLYRGTNFHDPVYKHVGLGK